MSKGIGREQIRRCMILGWKGDVTTWTVSINSTPGVENPLVLAFVARRDCQWRFRVLIAQAGEEIVDQLRTAGYDQVRVGSTVCTYRMETELTWAFHQKRWVSSSIVVGFPWDPTRWHSPGDEP